ncbi:Vacuolar morphogenesis protein 6 [Lunasporangiospora selenospora]|uniref:Vacuolar morphogenesis protein 6 n=1 Tax=Lunasporangiospora selenospora TaxID=979761 RepID=A0A9P6G2N9_9FUNG|nr:Vacuolar morphogenesis protein 6 [Lunasporangiospora selenospora]
MHDAFNVYTVIEKLPHKIESIFAQGDKLYVGTFYGTLLVYSVREPLGQDEAISVTLVETLKTFSKKAIEQIDILKAVGVLVSLSDGYVNLHDIDSYALRTQLGKTKGANLFSVFSRIEIQDELIPQVVTRLAVAVRRKILVFSWQDSEFKDTKEYSVPDRVRTMEWVGTQNLCIGFDSEYALMDCKTSVLTPLFSPSSPSAQSALGSTLESTLNTLNNFSSLATGGLMGFGSKPGKPLITRLPNDEILLGKENSSISVGVDGTPKRKSGIEWSGTPEELGYSYPYAVAILARHIEIRNIETRALVQSAEMPHARLLTQGKLLYIASTTEVWRLIPNSFSQQIDELVQKEEYEEAISLINQIDPVLLEDSAATMRRIKSMFAHHLFRNHRYEEALSLFLELDIPAEDVIALYPAVISSHLPPKEVEVSSSPKPDAGDSKDSGLKDPPPIIMSTKELEDAVGCLIRFLADKRQKIQKSLLSLQQSTESFSYSHLDYDMSVDDHVQILDVVDTALLKSYMLTNERLVGSLLRVTNYCNLEETENLLLKHKKYKELVDFYKGKGHHQKALELLKTIHTVPGEMYGVLPTVTYLQRLGADYLNLIMEYGTWVLELDPITGMKIFIDDEPEIDTLPRSRIIAYLERLSLNLCVMYLEHVIHGLNDQTSEFHNTLVVSYLTQIQRDSAAGNDDSVHKTRLKLLQFLDESTNYKAERILSRLPVDSCYEERAILLSRIGQHDQALNIYVHKLRNFQAAEEYCVKNFDSSDPTKNVYLLLLKVYLKPPNKEKPMLEPALDILTRHGNHINPTAVLNLLPPSTKVDQLFKFFEKSIRESNKTKHMDMIVKNLLKAERLQTQEQLTFYRSRRVKITEDRMCPKCNKRIGNSVFAVFPDGVVVHYSCKESMAAMNRWHS